MSVPAWLPWLVLGGAVAQRLLELRIARRNTAALLARGAYEVGAAHYPVIVAVHGLWLGCLAAWLATHPGTLVVGWAAAYVALQGVRVWVMRSLGPYWTTRVITVPNAPLVRRGPYRFVKHPNYIVVAAEIAILPLAFGAAAIAVVFTLLNAAVLFIRLQVESAALTMRPDGSPPVRSVG